MGQILHGCAKTTEAVRRTIQDSQEGISKLAKRYSVNPKTIAKWRKRNYVQDSPMGPKVARSTVLSKEEEAACIVFRRHSLLSLDDCLYALQENIPNFTRSSLHRLFQRHGIGRLPKLDEKQREKKIFKEAAANRYYYDTHRQLRQHLQTFINAYNFAKRLKSINGLTPYEFIIHSWKNNPDSFRINPLYLNIGLYS